MEVPRPLKHLVQNVFCGFYTVEQVIVVDLLIRCVVLKEDEMLELLRFEKKQLRGFLALLKNDKLIKFKLRMETDTAGKTFSQNYYYYINYLVFVNVVKYKLDHIRKNFELIDRDNTSRASFICSECNKSFADLAVDMLLDINTDELRCTFCNHDVHEDPNNLPKADSRKMLAKFNETMEPLYMLLKKLDDIRYPKELLNPDIPTPQNQQANHVYDGSFAQGKWADKSKGLRGPYGAMMGLLDGPFNVKIEDAATAAVTASAAANLPKKEQPIWMAKGGNGAGGSKLVNGNQHHHHHPGANIIENIDLNSLNSDETKEVFQAILDCEGKQFDRFTNKRWVRLAKIFGIKNEWEPFDPLANLPPPTIELKDDPKDDDWPSSSAEHVEFIETLPKVTVCGGQVSIGALTDKHISLMSDHEKHDYICVAQQIYSPFFDI
ncbi:General transcription factor IIE subunit 1 [Tyrophagus putrescentiae]|nr:General transcription factor IIE subunit 1 [Tyrophagus putrescentiae]